MININPQDIKNFLTLILWSILLFHTLQYLLAPLFYYSSSSSSRGLNYLSSLIKSSVLKIIVLSVIAIIIAFYFPIIGVLDFALKEFAQLDLQLNVYDYSLLIIWFSIIVSTFVIWAEESRSIERNILLKKSSLYHFDTDKYPHLEKKLRGIKLYYLDSAELTAYTYGGIFLAPRIVISLPLLNPNWEEQLHAVILHEINHIERKDIFWSMMTFGIQRIVLMTFFGIKKFLSYLIAIPIVGIVFGLLIKLVDLIESLWSGLFKLVNIISVQSEKLADKEVFAYSSPQNLILALSDVENNRIGNYTYSRDEKIANEIVQDKITEFNDWQTLSFFKKFKVLYQSTHPLMAVRFMYSAAFSERIRGGKEKSVNLIKYLFIICMIVLFGLEAYRSFKYEIKDKVLIQYLKDIEK